MGRAPCLALLIALGLGRIAAADDARVPPEASTPPPEGARASGAAAPEEALPAATEAQADAAPDDATARGPVEVTDPRELVEERLRSLRLERDAARVAGPALDHAEQALLRHDGRLATGDVAGARRALDIARAALVLASRQLDRAREEAALATARRMAETARARARAAAEALAVAQRRWEARQEGQELADPEVGDEVRSPADADGEGGTR